MSARADVILGCQWGDEGKGRIVDLYAADYDVVARFAGGDNAGHSIVVGERELALRIVPSGVLQPHVELFVGGGTVVNTTTLLGELDTLAQIGVDIDARAHLRSRARRAAVSRATRRGGRTRARRRGARHDRTRHRSGVRRSGRAQRLTVCGFRRSRSDLPKRCARPAPPEDDIEAALRDGERLRRAHRRRRGVPAATLARRQTRAARRRARHAARRRLRHVSVRHELAHDCRRRVHRFGHRSARDRRRARRLQGVLHARRRRAVSFGTARRTRRTLATPRRRVRNGHRTSAALRLVRRRRRALRRRAQRFGFARSSRSSTCSPVWIPWASSPAIAATAQRVNFSAASDDGLEIEVEEMPGWSRTDRRLPADRRSSRKCARISGSAARDPRGADRTRLGRERTLAVGSLARCAGASLHMRQKKVRAAAAARTTHASRTTAARRTGAGASTRATQPRIVCAIGATLTTPPVTALGALRVARARRRSACSTTRCLRDGAGLRLRRGAEMRAHDAAVADAAAAVARCQPRTAHAGTIARTVGGAAQQGALTTTTEFWTAYAVKLGVLALMLGALYAIARRLRNAALLSTRPDAAASPLSRRRC